MKREAKRREGAPPCSECGAPVKVTRGVDRYALAPGWAATIEGVELLHCEKCGSRSTVIEGVLPMQRAIAAAVVRKPTRLAAQEVKFLRTHLAMTAQELAEVLGVTTRSLTRWETPGAKPAERIGAVPDRLLRTVVLLADGGEDHYDPRQLAAIVEGDGPMRLTVRMKDGHWEARVPGKAA